MSDSSDNDELFGDAASEENEENIKLDPPPAYVNDPQFKKFLQEQKVTPNEKYGYVFIHYYKPFYFPGEIVRGSITFDLYNHLP